MLMTFRKEERTAMGIFLVCFLGEAREGIEALPRKEEGENFSSKKN